MTKYGVAIIGCGDMGTKHATAWSERPDARVVVVCDPQEDRAEKLAIQFGAHRVESWQDAIAFDGVDIVSVCVPACDHRDVAIAAAACGRHILCEKPMALTLEQADEMIAVANANSVHLSVCHQYRSLSRFKTMKRLIDEGHLGEQLYIRFTEMREVRPKLAMHRIDMNGGPVHDMSGHLFDLGRYLTGCEPVSVSAVGTVFARGKERVSSVTDFGVDTAEIQVRFEGGHCLSVSINWGLPEGTPGHSHDLVHGPLGMLFTVDPNNPDRFLGDLSDTLSVALKNANGTTLIACEPDHDGPQTCIEDLIGVIEGKRPSQFSGTEGRAALRIILAALESIKTRKTVLL
ncbi:MAG: Gfo/Idh/MocA family oxidoreductase [Paracoccaceae bacterium]